MRFVILILALTMCGVVVFWPRKKPVRDKIIGVHVYEVCQKTGEEKMIYSKTGYSTALGPEWICPKDGHYKWYLTVD